MSGLMLTPELLNAFNNVRDVNLSVSQFYKKSAAERYSRKFGHFDWQIKPIGSIDLHFVQIYVQFGNSDTVITLREKYERIN